MESEDLPLLEMDEEDDFLIPDPNQTLSSKSSSSLTHFTCSPLALPPSYTINYLPESRMDSVSSSSEDSNSNKENINSKNVEVPKLGIKPLQMKTRKKGGGYNLRKSLAWDRAFFTDEGILDPLELTLITGINANTYIGGLPTISEEGNDSFSSDSRRRNESSEEARLKELHDKSCTTIKGNIEKRSSAGDHYSLPHHNVTNKVLSINHTNRPVSKVGGCVKTLAASPSFLKRPANSNTLKTAKKESKLPKRPMSKPQSCFSATTKGSLAPSQLRHNMIPKPTTNVQKNVGLKSSVNVHVSQSKAKAGSGSLHLPTKELAKKTIRNLTNSSSKVASSTKLRLAQLEKASTGSEIVPDRLQFCEFQEEFAPIAAENLAQHTATNLNKLLTEAVRLTSSGPCHTQRASNELMILEKLHPCESQECPAAPQHMNLHITPINQPARPSGLRMPSPSLRFFDQRTTSESGSLLHKKTGSNRKIGQVRPPAAPRIAPMKSNDITEKAVSTLSTPCASTQLSPSPNYMANNSDTKDKFVLENVVDRPQSHTAISVSTSGQSIQHQEQNFTTVVDDSTEFNPESHLDAGRLDTEDQVFVESQKDGIVKREDEVDPGLENYSNLMQHEKIGQANNTAKVLDDKSLCMVDDARCNTDSPCSGNGDAIELNGIVTMMDTSCIPFQNMNIEQTNDNDDDVDSVDVFPTRSPVRDAGTLVLNDYPSAEKYFEATTPCVSALLNSQFCSKGQSVNCVMPAESSNLEKGPCANATEIDDDDDLFQEKSGSNHISAILMDVSEKKQDGALIPGQPLEQVQLEFREEAPLTDDHNQSSLSHLRPTVELLSVGDDDAFLKTESLLQVAQCASTFSQCLEKERLDLVGATIESEVKIHEEIHKSQEMGIHILSFSDKSILDVKSQHSCGNILEANPTVEGCTCESKSYSPFQSENQTLEGLGTISNFSKIHGEDTQVQLLENDILDHSCSRLTPDLHNHSIQDVDHSDTAIELKVVPESNHQLLTNTDNFQQLFVTVRNVVDGSDIYACDPKPSNGGKEINNNGHLCGESGSTVIYSHNEKHIGTYNTVCTDLGVPSKLESSGIDEMVGVKTTYYSASFLIEVADSMLEVKRRMSGELFDIGQISVDNDGMFMNYNLSPEKIVNLDEPDNALYGVIVVPEQSISHACDLQNSNACAHTNCMEFSDCNSSVPVSHQPTTGVETTSTTLCSVTAELCPVGGEEGSLLTSTYGIGADGSNIRLGQQVVEEGKSPMVDEFHHQLDNESDLEENKEATLLTKRSNNIRRQDNSLVIHPPNAVPFSDEWLAAIEAAGEEILTMKCGAVQHSPPDKSVPEPSPWSPVKKKANQIGPYDCTKYTNALPSNPN